MRVPATLIAAFPPSAELLLDRARCHIDDAMLLEIAIADYGWRADEMMAELRRIRDTGVVPDPMSWMLGEVLRLTRYCNPEVPQPPPFGLGPTGRRGHQTRLFACAVLLRAELRPDSDDCDVDSTLAQCLVSANVLGREMSEAVARFLTWRLSRRESGSEPLLFSLGLLILATRLRSGRLTELMLGTVADWVLAQEAVEQREIHPNWTDPKPLPFSVQTGFWRPLAAELSTETAAIRDDDVRIKLELCGLLLEPGWT